MSLTPETVTIKRKTNTPNGALGVIETWLTLLSGVSCTKSYKSPSNWQNVEGAAGVVNRAVAVFFFDGSNVPAGLAREDLIVQADGSEHKVINIRKYTSPTQWQVDVEQVI